MKKIIVLTTIVGLSISLFGSDTLVEKNWKWDSKTKTRKLEHQSNKQQFVSVKPSKKWKWDSRSKTRKLRIVN
ncbi:hypothetical protein [Candidatus Sulfurimonas baltica]|uniref:Uncharacterized protein n=1 Tax=Candidatus Sulfurimonas baltica TaxID=2740404 RepID=A0A7S7LUW8_9BACT|nr:hypothetical protein [Candidatus Sulfurimonas baltica]QOY51745.1 hypothetical protein HUE88_11660 [Candidatus Sulfurimonas baltica]